MKNINEVIEAKPWLFKVRSLSNRRVWHEVIHKIEGSFYCGCKDYKFRENECNHIKEVKAFIE